MTDETSELLVRARAANARPVASRPLSTRRICRRTAIRPASTASGVAATSMRPARKSAASSIAVGGFQGLSGRLAAGPVGHPRHIGGQHLPQYAPLAVALNLVGNPLKTIRRPDFIDFVIKNVRGNVALYLVLPGAKGMLSARLPLNNPPIMEAAAKSRTDVKIVLELLLKRLVAHPTTRLRDGK
jgi:hypothetical protein